MIYKNTEYTEAPPSVRVEHLEKGTNVWMHKEPIEVRTPAEGEGQPDQVAYVADTAFFFTPDHVEAEEIMGDFDGWWEYAETWTADQESPTVEQRIDDLEAALLSMLGF